MEWHIDAWDARGGRAFATQRTRNSDLTEPDENNWGPTVFIGPPSFRPEQIANIGIALNARRAGSFDPRVPLNEDVGELQFNTAEAVAEFVRRAFTNSIRNRGGDGGGGAIGFEGGPEGPPPSDGAEFTAAERYIDEWSHAAQYLEEQPEKVLAYYLDKVPHISTDSAPARAPGSLGSVEGGALQVLACVLDGAPLHGLHMPLFQQWQEAAGTLDAAITELGLWTSWHTTAGPARRRISDYLRVHGASLAKVERPKDFDGISFAQLLLRWQPTSGDPDQAAARFWQQVLHSQHFADDNRARIHATFAERYDAMFTWPLPQYMRGDATIRSVGDLLSAFVSAPSLFTKGTYPPRSLDIVSFAACLLASRMEDRTREGWRERAAATWLAGSVPRWVFRGDVEALILEPASRRTLVGASR